MTPTQALLILLRGCRRRSWLRTLLTRYADPLTALAAGREAWRECGADADSVSTLSAKPPIDDQDLRWLDGGSDRHVIAFGSADYPALLAQMSSAPPILLIQGDPVCLWQPQIAIVGSRQASPAGCEHAHWFAAKLAQAGFTITSGLADGIDAAAHQAALAAGRTIAVVATSPERVYPPRHIELAGQIAQNGAIVSEHPPGTPPKREHFPSRNRIIAGLSLGTIVIEAAQRSGALITARLAAEAGREVFAVPGSIRNPLARGCHQLIRNGATLIDEPEQVLESLQPTAQLLRDALRERLGIKPVAATETSRRTEQKAVPASALFQPDSVTKTQLWQALDHDLADVDTLVARTGLTAAAISSMLLLMELDGHITHSHGRYARHSRFEGV